MSLIPNYRPPRHEIEQGFVDENPGPLDRNNLIVVGPAYTHADALSGNLVADAYVGDAELSFRRKDGDVTVTKSVADVVDASWTTLIASKLRLQLFSKGTAGNVAANNAFNAYPADREGRMLHYKTVGDIGFLDLTSDIPAASYDNGRPPQAGDILKIEGSAATVHRKIVSLAGKDVAAAKADFGYDGAKALVEGIAGTTAAIGGVVHSLGDIDAGDITLEVGTGDLVGTLDAYARRYGTPITDGAGGLRLKFDLTCLTAGDGDAATFQLNIAGRSVAVTNVETSGDTTFTALGDVFEVSKSPDWVAGETLTFTADLPNIAETNQIATGDVTIGANYVYDKAVKKMATTVVIDILDVAADASSVKLRVSDTQGLVTPFGQTITGATTLTFDLDGATDGLSIAFPADLFASAHVGARFAVVLTPPGRSSTVFDKVVLDAPVGSILTASDGSEDSLAVTAYVEFSGTLEATEPVSGNANFTVAAEAVTLESSVYSSVPGYTNINDSVKPAVDGQGTVSVSWRAVLPVGSAQAPTLYNGTTAIEAGVGSTAIASELGFGLYVGLRAAGKAVYGLPVGGTSVDDWNAAIATLSTLKNVYSIVPLTEDEEILKLFSAHAAEMNRPEVKKFRRIYGAVDSPGEYVKYSTLDGNPVQATITSSGDGEYKLVTFTTAGVNLEDFPIYKGDKLRVVSTGNEYLIEYRGGQDTLVLQAGPAAPISSGTPVEIVASDIPENTARYVWEFAERIGSNEEEDRRISCVWTDDGVYDTLDGSPISIPNRFIAAEIGGYRVSLLPQQSLTRQEVSTITDAPAMYSKFSEELLNEIASHGVWIVTQEGPNEIPRVRHQLTTAAGGGPLRYEDSAGVIYDFLSFSIDDIIDPLIGKRNVVRRTLVEIKNIAVGKMIEHSQSPVDNEQVGPMIVEFYDRDGNPGTLNVDFDPDYKDSVLLFSEFEIPLTLNNARTRLLARTINTDAGITSEILIQRL